MDKNFKCGYCSFIINSYCQNYLEHECFMSFDENIHELVSDDNSGILTMVLKGTDIIVSNEEHLNYSWEETLIQNVQDRPALYDISLPVTERTNGKKNLLWAEIANKLEISIDEIKKRWKYLRDCYLKAKKKNTQYKPSGSASQGPVESGFRYYRQMKFLDDSTYRLPTVSSVSITAPSPSPSGSDGSVPCDTLLSPRLKRKKDEKKDLQKGILEALSTPLPTQDGIDGFLLRLGESLRRLT